MAKKDIDPKRLIEKKNDILFIFKKLEWLKDKIIKESKDLPNNFSNYLKEEKKSKREQILSEIDMEKIDFSEGDKITEEYNVKFRKYEHPVYFLIDSFYLTAKRAIEYCLRLLRAYYDANKIDNKLSWQNLKKHLDGETSTKSKFSEYLEKQNQEIVNFIYNNEEWIENINNRRFYLTHYGVELGFDEVQLKFSHKSKDINVQNPDESQPPEKISVDGQELSKKLGTDIRRLKKFRDLIQEACNDIAFDTRVKMHMKQLEGIIWWDEI